MNISLADIKSPITTSAAVIPLLKGALGALAAIAALVHVDVPGVSITADPWTLLVNAAPWLSTGIGLGFAKDFNVTGGTVVQATVPNPPVLPAPAIPAKA